MPLASCSNKRENPFLTEWDTPYGIPPYSEIQNADYVPAVKAGIAQQAAEIEAIVSTGMKLNLDYYIEENLDEEIVEEIYDYFKNDAKSDDVQSAIEELGPDYYENEVRLVRLKFLCEIAS